MTTEIKIAPAIETIADYKAALRDWQPRTDEEAGAFLAMRSLLSGKDGDAAKEAATARLLKRCETRDCEELEFPGFRAKAVFKTVPAYGPTEYDAELAEAEARVKELKTRRDAERKINGPEHEEVVFSHFLIQPAK